MAAEEFNCLKKGLFLIEGIDYRDDFELESLKKQNRLLSIIN